MDPLFTWPIRLEAAMRVTTNKTKNGISYYIIRSIGVGAGYQEEIQLR